MNEDLANRIVARLKHDGRLSLPELAEQLDAGTREVEETLGALVKRGDVRVSPRKQYYATGQPSAPAPPKTRAKPATRTALVTWGIQSGSGVGFGVDGTLVMPGDVLTHQTLLDIFRVGNMGGIRISKTVGAIVLISSVHNDLYKDRQQGEIFTYTGEGKLGDQTLTRGNSAVDRSLDEGTPLLLFFKKATNEYEFQGEVRLAGPPTQERQPDENGMMRNVWVFPLSQA